MTFDVEAFLDSYERPTRQVPVCPRAGLVAEYAEVEAAILKERGDSLAAPAGLFQRLDELDNEINESVKVFTLTARTYKEWADLMAKSPPTREQAKQGLSANPDTFEVAALAACATDPELSVENAQRMRDTLPPSEWRALIDAVVGLHQERVSSPKSLLRSVARLMNEDFSNMSGSEGLHEAGSLGGNGKP